MTPEQAAWVRASIWPAALRKQHETSPLSTTSCGCSTQVSYRCEAGKHQTCHLGVPLPHPETYITDRRNMVLNLPEPFTHPSVSATGWHDSRAAAVWLAGRACAARCACPCVHVRPVHAPENHPVHGQARPRPVRYERVPLPGLELLGVSA